jgi:hypothetical protein
MKYYTFRRKINAIKDFRLATGLGLKDSKDMIEAAERNGLIDLFMNGASVRPFDVQLTDAESAALMRLVYMWARAEHAGATVDQFVQQMDAHGTEPDIAQIVRDGFVLRV